MLVWQAREYRAYACGKGYCGANVCAKQGDMCQADAECCGHACAGGIRDGALGCELTGGKCGTNDDCCAHDCSGGSCYIQGSIGPDACQSINQCVTGLCTNGRCNLDSSKCLSGPGTCENCLALNCCDAMADCIGSHDCASALRMLSPVYA